MALTKSAEWLARSQKVIAGGVNSDVRRSELPHPLFFQSGKGSRLYDIDGNEYIDYVLGQGPLLLGHSPRPVLDAVHKQLEQGLVYAAQHEAETELAELLTEVIPCAQKVRFNSTGSEAVITALRIARAYRNRPLVVKFEGHWHGWYDSLFISTSPSLEQAGPRELPTAVLPSQGQVRNAAENVICHALEQFGAIGRSLPAPQWRDCCGHHRADDVQLRFYCPTTWIPGRPAATLRSLRDHLDLR